MIKKAFANSELNLCRNATWKFLPSKLQFFFFILFLYFDPWSWQLWNVSVGIVWFYNYSGTNQLSWFLMDLPISHGILNVCFSDPQDTVARTTFNQKKAWNENFRPWTCLNMFRLVVKNYRRAWLFWCSDVDLVVDKSGTFRHLKTSASYNGQTWNKNTSKPNVPNWTVTNKFHSEHWQELGWTWPKHKSPCGWYSCLHPAKCKHGCGIQTNDVT